MLVVAALTVIFAAQTHALFEKEAGHYDWMLPFLGEPVALAPSQHIPSTFLLMSRQGSLGRVDASTGALVWSSPLPSSADALRGLVEVPSGEIIVSLDKSIACMTADGLLKWSIPNPTSSSVSTCSGIPFIQLSHSSHLVHLSDGSIDDSPSKPSCNILDSTQKSTSPIEVAGITITILPGHVISASHPSGSPVWTREESVASATDVLLLSLPTTTLSHTHNLEWLMGGRAVAVILSLSANRLTVIDIGTSSIISAFSLPVDSQPHSLRKSSTNPSIVNLVDSSGLKIAKLNITSNTLVSVSGHPITHHDHTYKLNDVSGEIVGWKGAAELYRINLRQRILKTITPSHTEFGSVPVLVKGDASIVFKYMNPNVVLVITAVAEAGGLSVVLFDSITGAVVYNGHIRSASPDASLVHGVVCDNWIVLHYYDVQDKRFEVLSVDLFDKRGDKGFYAAATGDASSAISSAYDLPVDPISVAQQYVFPLGPVTAVAVTATLQGVTPRQVIFATNNGLYAIRKDVWLNPRRPGGDNIHSRLTLAGDEPLPPYTPLLPVIPTDFVSHSHVVENVALIKSIPTHLESTSIVVAVGANGVFVSPVYIGNAPYDVLSPFFNYWLLYGSVSAVVVAVAITTALTKRKALYDKWK